MRHPFQAALAAAMIGLTAASADAALIALGQASATGITATITPDATETGTVNVYMGAQYKGQWFLRSGAANWVPYTGGAFPVPGKSLPPARSRSASA